MKHMKKLGGLLLALVMALALMVPAMAAYEPAENCTVTYYDPYDFSVFSETSTHTFKGYQLLTLTISKNCDHTGTEEDHSDNCYNYGYELNGKYKTVLFATAGLTATGNDSIDRTLLVNKLQAINNDGKLQEFANNLYKAIEAAGLEPEAESYTSSLEFTQGYWLLADTTEVDGKDDAKSLVLLDTAGQSDITVTPKVETPTVEKDVSDSATGTYGDSTDVNIGDTVYFELTGTMTKYTAYYETYKYVFHDTLSAGLTMDTDSVKVYLKNGATETEIDDAHYDVTTGSSVTDGCNLHVSFDDLLDVDDDLAEDSEIIVRYTATLNDGAVIGNPGNPNTVYLEYSNNPFDTEDTGKTPEDKVVVFTYELDVTKVDNADTSKKLAGAEFVLSRGSGTSEQWLTVDTNGKVSGWVSSKANASTLVSDSNGAFEVVGLDAGTYYLEETKAPAGYNLPSEPFTVVVTASVDSTLKLGTLSIKVDDGEAQNGNVATGVVEMTVVNSSGTKLPATGGMGTAVLYALGSAMVLGAAIVLITRKRMSR